MLTVRDVYDILNEMAPYDTQEDFDNSGLNVGKSSNEVHKILVALDVNENVVNEAVETGAELIVSHHPLLFHARKNLVEEDPEGRILCKLVRNNISVISAHTNLDLSVHSGSACIARKLGLANIRSEEFLYLGELNEPVTADELNNRIENVLHAPVRIYGNRGKMISTLAIAGGAYDIGFTQAMECGAQALLTGEVRHHNALAASMEDFVLFDGTHYGTEAILVPELANTLQKQQVVVQSNVKVYSSGASIF
ncbi:MAG: Nif3-like dinuclear metal center hexameric protein [Clostridiales bacterium]|jgi:dinuclear metal center protein, YbgI/SA1388 family|nr:Nif3-like dinuclear metal center hexameric protein [Clostridiales bacterium]